MTASFDRIRQAAEARCGSAAGLEERLKERLQRPKTPAGLRALPDDRYLSLLSLRIFRAGLKHSLVDAKWPAFEEAFHGFDPRRVRAMNDEALEALMADTRLIRHWGKIKATRDNAAALCTVIEESGSFGAYLADWPAGEVVGLWHDLGKRFKQMGGSSAPVFLRMAGKDTFVPTGDVVRALNRWGAFDGEPKGKKAQAKVQDAFRDWAGQSNKPLCEISMILALSVD